MTDDLVRLRPSQQTREPAAKGPESDEDFDAYLMAMRDALAGQLREVERLLLKRGKITRLLCAPGQKR